MGKISIWNLEVTKLVREFEGHDKVTSISTHNNPAILLSGGKDGYLKLWDLRKKDAVFSNKGHKGGVKAIDSKQNLSVSGGKEGSVKLCDFRKFALETISSSEKVTDVSIGPSGDRVAVVHSNSIVKIYNLASFETINTTACSKSLIIKYKPEGIFVLSPNKLTVLNTLGITHQISTKWTYPVHISPQNTVVSRELGIDLWGISNFKRKEKALDLEKLVREI